MNNPKIGSQGKVPVISAAPPVFGLLQADFVYQENCDATHALNLDYFIPVNCQRVITARLSFRRRAYETYSNFSVTATGNASVDHTHSIATEAIGESGHSHSHSHTIPMIGAVLSNAVSWPGAGFNLQVTGVAGGDTAPINADATGSSGHTHNHAHGSVTGGQSATHTHTVNGSSFLGVSTGAIAAGITTLFDGVDQTANLVPAGPFNTDQVEIDVTKFISTAVDRSWHVVALQPTGLGRIQAVLRILYNSNQV